jgi:hypothetical protein
MPTETRYIPENRNPEDLYVRELNRHIKNYLEKFRKGEIDRERVHKELRDGIEAALQAIESYR